ncbi:MAG TPA: hypothetical protein VGH66_11995 [Acidimicrobiales bacterium]
MALSRYVIDYTGTFWFDASPQQVWAGMERVDDFPCWWHWLREFHVDGQAMTPGSVLRGVVCPPLPYRMQVMVRLVECVWPRLVRADVHGDLEGEAGLALETHGDRTRATAAWTIEMMQPPMRVAARLAHPLLRWGHDRVVETTVAGFRAQVASIR